MEKALKILLVFGIFAVPMSSMIVMKGTIVWYPQFLTVLCIGFLGLSLLIWSTSRPLSILSLFCLFSYIFICHQHPRALLCLLAAYSGILVCCFIASLEDRSVIWKALVVMACLQAIFVVFQIFGLDPVFKSLSGTREVVGFVGSRNQLGLYYTSMATMLFSMSPWLVAVAILPLAFAKCTSALIGAAAGLFLYLIFQRRDLILKFICSAVVLFIFWRPYDGPHPEVLKERWGIIDLTMTQATEGRANQKVGPGYQLIEWNPLIGCGIGGFAMVSPKTQGDVIFVGFKHRYEHAHNDLAEAFFDLGWAGVAIIFWAFIDILVLFAMSGKTKEITVAFCCLVAQALASFGVYSIHAPTSFFLFCVMLGLFLGACKYENKGTLTPQTA